MHRFERIIGLDPPATCPYTPPCLESLCGSGPVCFRHDGPPDLLRSPAVVLANGSQTMTTWSLAGATADPEEDQELW